jgi:hypothetical protein
MLRVTCTVLATAVALTLLPVTAHADMAPDTTAAGPEIPNPHVQIAQGTDAPRWCLQQGPQDFLIRSNWFRTGSREIEKTAREQQLHGLNYRTEKYGRFESFGSPGLNAHPPSFYAGNATFMGLPIQMNRRVLPALLCVEAALKAAGVDGAYKPVNVGGIRFRNTYRGPEVSNHVFGIAIDIEPHRNTCCNCVAPWPDHALCKKRVTSIYERMSMPRSWVVVFERYGFYWLGHDVLQDTMHFEFLGDPDQILAPFGAAAPVAASSGGTPVLVASSTTASTPIVAPPLESAASASVPSVPSSLPVTYRPGAPLVSRLPRVVEMLRAQRTRSANR